MESKFETLRIKHGLDEEEFTDWVHKWTHAKLAEMLTTEHIDKSQGPVTLEDKFRNFSFESNLPSMQLNISLRGEDRVLEELNKTYYASREDKHMTPLRQKKLLKILDENFSKNNPFILAMQTSGTTVTDVDSWIRLFRLVRNKARIACLEAQKYGAYCQPFKSNSRASRHDEQT
jgi:hypothetical protein